MLYPQFVTMKDALNAIKSEATQKHLSHVLGEDSSHWYDDFLHSDIEYIQRNTIRTLDDLQTLDAFLHRYQEKAKVYRAKKKISDFRAGNISEEKICVPGLPSGLVSLMRTTEIEEEEKAVFLPILSLVVKDKKHLMLYGENEPFFSLPDEIVSIHPSRFQFESVSQRTNRQNCPITFVAFSKENKHSKRFHLRPSGEEKTILRVSETGIPILKSIEEDKSFGGKRGVCQEGTFDDNILSFGLAFQELPALFRRLEWLTSHTEIALSLIISTVGFKGDFISNYRLEVTMGTEGGFYFNVSDPQLVSQVPPPSN